MIYYLCHDIVKVKLQSTELKSAKKPFLSGYDHSPEKAQVKGLRKAKRL